MGGEIREQELLPLLEPELYTASPWGLAPCPALLWSEEQDFAMAGWQSAQLHTGARGEDLLHFGSSTS